MKRLLCLLIAVPIWIGFEGSAYPRGVITVNVAQYPINVTAGGISTWQMEGIRVFSANGNVKISQGRVQISANEATCWFYELEAGQKPVARMEILAAGNVVLIQGRDYDKYEEVYLRLETAAGITVNTHGGGAVQTLGEEQLVGSHLKLKKIKELGLSEFAYKEPLELELEEGPPAVSPVVDIVANDIDSWTEGDARIVIAIGDVEIKRAGQTLTADNAILWFDQQRVGGKETQNFKEFFAEGDVTIVMGEKEEEIRRADKVFENFVDAKGFYVNPRLKMPIKNFPLPIYTGGKEMKQVSRDKFVVKDGYVTTCSFGHPHFHVSSPKVKIRKRFDEEGDSYMEAKAYNSIFYVGGLPVAYMPVYKYSTRRKETILEDYSVGTSGRYGTFIRTDWNPYALPFVPESLGDWSDVVVNLDYLNKRGPAVGFEFEYEREGEKLEEAERLEGKLADAGIEGYLETYYVNDKLKKNEAPPREVIKNRNRGRILWRHRQQLTEDWRADAELSYLSDRGFLKEYFEREFREGKKQETYLSLRRLRGNRGTTLLFKDQINRFQTGPEERPLVAYHVIGQPLWENRLNLTSETELGFLDVQKGQGLKTRDIDTYRKLDATTTSAVKGDTENTVSWPFKWWVFKANPFVGGRTAGYSKSLEDGGPNGGATARFIGSLGLDASTQFWRVYGLENRLLRINGLRHLITPEVRWRMAPTVTKRPEDLLQYERSDGLYKYNSAIIGIRNRIQTRRGPPWKLKTVDLFEFDIEAHLFDPPRETSGPVVRTMMTAEGVIEPKRDNFLQFDLRTQLTNRLAMESTRNEFNLSEKDLDVFNWGLSFRSSGHWSYFAGYRFIKDVSSAVSFSANTLLGKTWRATFSESFDLGAEDAEGGKTSKNLYSNFTFAKEYHDWTAGINISFDVVNRNNAFSFVLTPKGVRRSFGRSYSYAGR
ncbi:MAG: LPS assembly protein LptD [Candidatus Brocadiales bacterium]